MTRHATWAAWMIVLASGSTVLADKNVDVPPVEPGDEMIHAYLSRLAVQTDAQFLPTLPAPDAWAAVREQWRQEYFYMLGLSPMPERPPLNPIITGTLQRDGYAVDKLWFESRPHLVVTANLYRPTNIPAGTKLPAVLYVCGHGSRRPEGTKSGYQSPPIWFARHGYVCLILDTLDRGEIKGVHRGLFSDGKRWWLSRGYTPAGVECWNGIRGIDYLVSRPDVDASRIAVTGISGGGAATFWIAAADDRVKAAVPISGMADLQAYVADNKVEVHCDCMFMGNIFAWPWSRIAALVAPRPLLFVNSDNDKFFPIDANERVINRLERWYGMLGAGDKVDAVVSVGGHDYRQDIRQAACRFINIHLKNDPSTVTDSEQDLVKDEGDKPSHPIELKDLAVFPDGKGLPADAINATVDQVFVPMAKAEPPPAGQFDAWKKDLLTELRRVTFRAMPERVPMGRELGRTASGAVRLGSEEGIECRLAMPDSSQSAAKRIVLMVSLEATADASKPPQWLNAPMGSGDVLAVCQPRGVGDTRWNAKAPPNRVERQLALVGRTVETGQVWDVVAAARYLASTNPGAQVIVAGEKAGAVLATYAALLEPEIAGAILKDPPASHMEPTAPQFLNVLRVCDVPQAIGMLAPRPLTLSGDDRLASMVKQVYATAGVTDRLTLR